MATYKKRGNFTESEEGIAIREKLTLMAGDAAFNTASSYSANSVLYPNNKISFEDKHMNYLMIHPELEPNKYLANIRLMTRVR